MKYSDRKVNVCPLIFITLPMVLERFFGSKSPKPLELNPSEQELIKDVKAILLGRFDQFAKEEAGVTVHCFGLSTTGLRLDVLIKKLRGLGISADDKMDELSGLSLSQLERAHTLATQKLNAMRKSKKSGEQEVDPDELSAVGHFRKSVKHLKK